MSGASYVFKDHFSGHAADYAAFRPTYPAALFAWLAGQSPGRELAWDCATGNGQAAIALAEHFERVVASDASAEQVAVARPHPRVSYCIEPAEHSGRRAASVDLLTVAQAYHWFEHGAFHSEAVRVIRPGGLLAVWTYPLARTDEAVDAVVLDLYDGTLAEDWPAERRFVDSGYADLPLPWPDLEPPEFEISATWTLDALAAYLGTWSAVRRYRAREGRDPLESVRADLARAWGDPAETKMVRWPLILRVCRKPL